MGSKLRVKGKKPKSNMPFSNKQMQHMAMEFHTSREQLEQLERDAYDDGWTTSEDWTNLINSVAMYYALRDLYGFGAKRFLKVIQKANEYVTDANDRKHTIMQLVEGMEQKGIRVADEYKELVKKVGL